MTFSEFINVVLLLTHGLVSVALLGAITHQCVALLRPRSLRRPVALEGPSFVQRYRSVSAPHFALAVTLLYPTSLALGAVLYPEYRVEARYALEEMRLLPIVGLFELKEHFSAFGVGLLPLYWQQWRANQDSFSLRATTLTLGVIVWFAFIVGHLVNNFRGL